MWNENVEINVRATAGVGWLPTPQTAWVQAGQNIFVGKCSVERFQS